MKFSDKSDSEIIFALHICEANISYTKCISYRRYFTRRKANFIEKTTSEEVVFSGGDGGDRGASPSHLLRKFPRFYVPRAPPGRTARDGLWVRSPIHFIKRKKSSKSYSFFFGGDGGDRTHDLLTASQTLSQLSYAPVV